MSAPEKCERKCPLGEYVHNVCMEPIHDIARRVTFLRPGPSCPFVLLDERDAEIVRMHENHIADMAQLQKRIAELDAAINKARMLMLGDPYINASDKLECASYALDEARPLPESDVRIEVDGEARAVDYTGDEPEVCEYTFRPLSSLQMQYTRGCDGRKYDEWPDDLMGARCGNCGNMVHMHHQPEGGQS